MEPNLSSDGNNYELFKKFPEDIILMIFDYLDQESLWNVIFASDYCTKIISNSSKLLNTLVLNLNDQNLKTIVDYPKFPIRNVTFTTKTKCLFGYLFVVLLEIFEKFGDSLENAKFEKVSFGSDAQFSKLMIPLSKLKSISFVECSIRMYHDTVIPEMKCLKFVDFDRSGNEFFQVFHGQKYIEKVAVNRETWSNNIAVDEFDIFTESLPNLKELVLLGNGTSFYFDDGEFPFKIEKLEAFLLGTQWECREPRLRFLQSQKGYLKELKLLQLPNDYDGDQVLKFIIEEMELKTFYLGDTPLILDGTKQDVVEGFTADEFQLKSIYEMFRQFPEIQRFTMLINKYGRYNKMEAQELVNSQTTLFKKAKILEIKDFGEEDELFLTFLGLYIKFTNVQKFLLSTGSSVVNSVLGECLMHMPTLKEIVLDTSVQNQNQRFEIIRQYAPNINKLSVAAEFLSEARNYFRNDDIEIIEI